MKIVKLLLASRSFWAALSSMVTALTGVAIGGCAFVPVL